MYVCMYVCMFVCLYVCMFVENIYIYRHIHRQIRTQTSILLQLWRPAAAQVNEGSVDEWAEQLGEALEVLRQLRDRGASVNVSCQMGGRALWAPFTIHTHIHM